jgi:hypothetical protein
MDRSLSKMAAGCISAVILMGATAMSANANYLGYANGDPGNWDFWTEQAGGPKQTVEAPAAPAAAVRHAPTRHLHYYRHQQEKHTSSKQ